MMKNEVCPKCCSQDVAVWGFNDKTVDYECNTCRHKWIALRRSSSEIVHSYSKAASYRECKRKKFNASSLEEFCRRFKEHKDKKVQIWPYLPRYAVEGDSDFGLIVESGHVKYEVGLSGSLFIDENSLLRRWTQPQRSLVFDFSQIKRKMGVFENFARGLSQYLTEKGCHAIAGEIQHLSRTPESAAGNEDLKTVVHILAEYC